MEKTEKTMKIKGTTILAVRHKGRITVAGDGQVTLEATILKHGARKVRRLYNNEVIVGFAGATADAARCRSSPRWTGGRRHRPLPCSG